MHYPKPPDDKIYDAIIVGSGAGGLTAGVKMAIRGVSVLILEQAPSFGGYLNPFRWKEYTFDTGLHYVGELGEGGAFRKMLGRLGLEDRIKFIELNPDGFNYYHFGNTDFVLPKGRAVFRNRLFAEFPGHESEIEKFFKTLSDLEMAVDAVTSMGRGFLSKLRGLRYLPGLAKYFRSNYKQILDDITDDVRLQTIFSLFSGEIGLPPSKCSVFPGFLVFSHYLQGAFYPEGGGGGLRDAMVRLIQEKNGFFRRRFEVRRITKDGSIFQVFGSKGTYKSRSVIGNADPKIMFEELIDPSLNIGGLRRKAEKTIPSLGGFYAFIGTDLDLPAMGITDANIFHGDFMDVEENWVETIKGDLPENFRSFMITSPSLKDPRHPHAPKGKYAIEVVSLMSIKPFMKWADVPSRRRGPDYDKLKQDLGMKLLKKVERYIPGLTKHLDFVEFATPLSNLYWVNAPAGGCYGPDQIPSQMGMGRFRITTPIPGLFLAGAGVYGGGVFPSMKSGEDAGGQALKFLNR